LGPWPAATKGKSRLAGKVVFDSGNGSVASMLGKDSVKFRIVEGELMGVDEGENVGPVLVATVARRLVEGVEFQRNEPLDVRGGKRSGVILGEGQLFEDRVVNEHEVDGWEGEFGGGFQLEKVVVLVEGLVIE